MSKRDEILRRLNEAAEDAHEEGLMTSTDPERLATLAAFMERKWEEIGAAQTPVVGFMDDGRVECLFPWPSDGIARTVFFISEREGMAKKVDVFSDYSYESKLIPYPNDAGIAG